MNEVLGFIINWHPSASIFTRVEGSHSFFFCYWFCTPGFFLCKGLTEPAPHCTTGLRSVEYSYMIIEKTISTPPFSLWTCNHHFPVVVNACQVFLLFTISLCLSPSYRKGLCCWKCDWFWEWSALSQEQLNKEVSQYGCSQMVGQWGRGLPAEPRVE